MEPFKDSPADRQRIDRFFQSIFFLKKEEKMEAEEIRKKGNPSVVRSVANLSWFKHIQGIYGLAAVKILFLWIQVKTVEMPCIRMFLTIPTTYIREVFCIYIIYRSHMAHNLT